MRPSDPDWVTDSHNRDVQIKTWLLQNPPQKLLERMPRNRKGRYEQHQSISDKMQFMKFVLNYHAGEVRETFFFKLESMIPHGHVTCARCASQKKQCCQRLASRKESSHVCSSKHSTQRATPPRTDGVKNAVRDGISTLSETGVDAVRDRRLDKTASIDAVRDWHQEKKAATSAPPSNPLSARRRHSRMV